MVDKRLRREVPETKGSEGRLRRPKLPSPLEAPRSGAPQRGEAASAAQGGDLHQARRNVATTSVSFLACSFRLSAAAALSSTSAAFCCVIWSS
jgi:hypothetical protein